MAGRDILMLEASPQQQSAPSSIIIDALPYIDDDYANPNVKQEVDRLVEEEMRRSSKKPSDFLKDLPPLPRPSFQVPNLSIQIDVCVSSAVN